MRSGDDFVVLPDLPGRQVSDQASARLAVDPLDFRERFARSLVQGPLTMLTNPFKTPDCSLLPELAKLP